MSVSAVSPGVVGLAGLEPAASSLSGIEGSALYGPPFPQVTAERRKRNHVRQLEALGYRVTLEPAA